VTDVRVLADRDRNAARTTDWLTRVLCVWPAATPRALLSRATWRSALRTAYALATQQAVRACVHESKCIDVRIALLRYGSA
jgi:hypothetical protein